ncbi:MAG: hypothetical protein ACKPA7_12070 [Sphaerospermopsis kisseleviana]
MSDQRYLTALSFIKSEREKKVMLELCTYTGIATISLLFGLAVAINPLAAGLLGLGVYQYASQKK